ncbi:MAG: diguanylate cyclase [gamma proteobacterium symbiont of Bathyaustriella thionipta]|nr:diguanylate cyclase [gamma proteobacterium symbiont of Bathyaustriella thionipta]
MSRLNFSNLYSRWLVVVLLTALAWVLADSAFVRAINRPLFDQISGLLSYHPDHTVVLIDIGDDDLAEQGRWPWSRDKMAHLQQVLTASDARAIAYDILFIEPDRAHPEGDYAFARAVAAGPPTIVSTLNGRTPYETLWQVVAGVADKGLKLDEDWRLRRLQVHVEEGLGWPVLPVALLQVHASSRDLIPQTNSMMTPFPASGLNLEHYSYHDVISGKVGKDKLANKFVIVGVSATGIASRLMVGLAMMGRSLSGIEVQAWLTQLMLNGDLVKPLEGTARNLLLVILTLLLLRLVLWGDATHILRQMTLAGSLLLLLSILFMLLGRIWLPPASILIALLSASLLRAASQWHLLHRQAHQDGLTGIANRRTFQNVLQREWDLGVRSAEPLSLVMLDVDRFKAYNDQYGHTAGDKALSQIAAQLAKFTRRSRDLAARYGGEEFIYILPGADHKAALKIAEQIRLAVLALDIEHQGGGRIAKVAVSQGVATVVPGHRHSSDWLVAQADEALYAAKHAGRNRVHSAQPMNEAELCLNPY